MALSWKENYATLISANTWNESVEGYKVTNVFGLAWNYYVMYTKFITGVDLTLDLGGKFEFFFADTYKIGYANETAFGKAGRTDLQNLRLQVCAQVQEGVQGAYQGIFGERQVVVGNENQQIDAQNAVLGEQNVDVAGAQVIFAGGDIDQEAGGAIGIAAGADLNLDGANVQINGAAGVTIDGAIVEIL